MFLEVIIDSSLTIQEGCPTPQKHGAEGPGEPKLLAYLALHQVSQRTNLKKKKKKKNKSSVKQMPSTCMLLSNLVIVCNLKRNNKYMRRYPCAFFSKYRVNDRIIQSSPWYLGPGRPPGTWLVKSGHCESAIAFPRQLLGRKNKCRGWKETSWSVLWHGLQHVESWKKEIHIYIYIQATYMYIIWYSKIVVVIFARFCDK